MKDIIAYCALLLVLAFSIFLNVQDSKKIAELKNSHSLDELPFLKKVVEVANYQHFFESKRVDIPQIELEKPYLCVCYLSTMCESCIDASLQELEYISDLIGSENIFVITDYKEKRDIQLIKSALRKSKIRMLSMSDIKLDNSFFQLMTANIPLMFVVDNDKYAKSVSLHIKEVPAYNQEYYKTIQEIYFNNK